LTVHVDRDAVGATVRKAASSADERRRLAFESKVLAAAAHPGVVRLVDVEGEATSPDALLLGWVSGGTLAESEGPAPDEFLRLGAALATTVADLHDIGVVHRAIDATHVMLDEKRRPVLCGFGSALRAPESDEIDRWREQDLRDLAGLLLSIAPEGASTRAVSTLRAANAHRSRRRHGGARSLAASLAAAGATSAPLRPRSRRLRPLRGPARRPTVVAVACVALLLLAGRVGTRGPASVPAATPVGAPRCPAVDAGCTEFPLSGGVLAGRARLVNSGGTAGRYDEAVLGRWNCTQVATPAALDGRSGRLWVFDDWPVAGRGVVARLVATVPGAADVRVLPSSVGPSCDWLEVDVPGRARLVVDPRPK